tara:strand:- start:668 stop:1177 length:510 start_codon:yes stop_codon:yes gene_type:complete
MLFLYKRINLVLSKIAGLFEFIAILCLSLMLIGTAITIILRPFELSFYWIWPWTIQLFVWMCFFGFFPIYMNNSDISVKFLVNKLDQYKLLLSGIFIEFIILTVIGLIILELPTIFSSQVGKIDGVITPWGVELERYTLSLPLAFSCILIVINSLNKISYNFFKIYKSN